MRILHISDFHLDKLDKREYINHILKPLRTTIETESLQKRFDFVFFCGDLVNKGGASYNSLLDAFNDFDSFFIKPLLKYLDLERDRFLFVPGNHDIERSADSKFVEVGMTKTLIDYDTLKAFFQEISGINRVTHFLEFEKEFYSNSQNLLHSTEFYSVFNFKIQNNEIGIVCLNTSWRCYDSNSDYGKLIFSEEKILEAASYIEDCNFKFCIAHHHYEWASDFEKEVVFEILKQNFDFFFCGHEHKLNVNFCDDPDGKLFTFCAPGMLSPQIRNPQKKYENGIAIIDFDLDSIKLSAKYFKAEHPKKHLILNSSVGINGVWEKEIPRGEKLLALIAKNELVGGLLNDHRASIDTHLLSYATDSNSPKKLDDIFVLPNISLKEKITDVGDDELLGSLDEILKNDYNFIIYGAKESGKTIFLDKLFTDSILDFKILGYIPVYIDFNNYKSNIFREIRNFLGLSNKRTQEILNNEKIILFIDNISFEPIESNKINELKRVINNSFQIKVISTYLQFYDEDYPTNFDLFGFFNFKTLTIKQFKSKQIKVLIKKWFGHKNDLDSHKKLETLTKAFLSLNLPRTPFAVSMFLWIIEKQESYTPLNNSTLVDTFLEKLLKKNSSQEVKRETFGYDNKIWIISDLAKEMLFKSNTNYGLSYSEYVEFVSSYLKSKKFDHYGVNKISNELLEDGIFTLEDNFVRFRFTCFFEFFLMKKMTIDDNFLEYVFREENYLQFVNEIDYFTGINRGKSGILQELLKRLDEKFIELRDLIDKTVEDKQYKSHDDFFVEVDKSGRKKPSLISQLNEEKVMKFLPSSKPTEEDLEIMHDEQLQLSGNENGIRAKEGGNQIKDFAKVLVLLMKVVKNSEEIDLPNLKLNAYNKVLQNSIYFALLHKAVFQLITSESEKVPPDKLEDFLLMDKHLPLIHQMFLKEHIGTSKLLSIIKEKIDLDKINPTSEFEKVLSIFLYSDLKGSGYQEIIKELIKNSKNGYIKDLIFFKLVTYYFYRSKNSESDSFYLNIIADLIIKSKGLNKTMKSKIMSNYKRQKNEKLN